MTRLGLFLLFSLAIAGLLTFAPIDASAKVASSPDVKKISAAWSPPNDGQSSRNALGSKDGPIELVSLFTDHSFGDVWNFYAKKIGIEKEYEEKKAYIHHGTTEQGHFFLHDRAIGDAPRTTKFVHTSEHATVNVQLSAEGKGTRVELTVVAH